MTLFRIKKICLLLTKLLYVRAMMSGIAATVEHRRILEQVKDCHLIVDGGANKGQFAVLARSLWPDAQISCFEPLAEPRSRLQRISALLSNVRVFPLALHSTQSTMNMFLTKRRDSSSLLKPENRIKATKDQCHVADGETEIETTTLDDWVTSESIGDIDLIKLDLQGAELQALLGATNCLKSTKFVFCELSYRPTYKGQPLCTEVIVWLSQQGFDLVGVSPSPHGVGSWEADFLFKNSSFSEA